MLEDLNIILLTGTVSIQFNFQITGIRCSNLAKLIQLSTVLNRPKRDKNPCQHSKACMHRAST